MRCDVDHASNYTVQEFLRESSDRKFLATLILSITMQLSGAATGWASDESENRARFECCYRVRGVPRGDALNIRALPGSTDTLVGTIPPNANDVFVARCERVPGLSEPWCLIRYRNVIGWVNGRFVGR